ncbi:MAG: rod shape-determining protein RodA [Bacteroidia bacterium]|nr:rod shape-determining protein RodA [Bacteroidia bacterium]
MNRKSFDFDIITLSLFLGLLLLGWMTIYAVSSAGDHTSLLDMSVTHGKQAMWIGLALVFAMIILSLDYQFIEAISYIAYGVSIALLIVVLVAGREINGAKSWLVFGGVQFQPSEFAKLATALALSRYMSRLNFSMNNLRQLTIAGMMVIVPALIVIFQNDTGSALVFASFMLVFFREGLNPLVPIILLLTGIVAVVTLGFGKLLVIAACIAGVGVVSFLYFYNQRQWFRLLMVHVLAVGFLILLSVSVNTLVSKLQEHQQLRIKVLFDPNADPQGAGYNVIQSKIAIGSGGISGKGYLEGNYTKYKFVPKQVTDFIYCTIGEEYGWIGSSAVVILFFLLIWRIRFLAENSKTRFARIYGYSVLSIIFFHVMVNIGMTIGLMPVIGIPLPFFSYGGSSLLAFTALIFIMVNLYSYRISVLGSKI